MSIKTLRFTALDTLFFRESRPFEAIGGSELTSLFPPPPRTVAGAIRSTIGESLGADWHAFHQDLEGYTVGGVRLRELIGYGPDDLGKLGLAGLYLTANDERLYPSPFLLLRKGKDADFRRLLIGDSCRTSLGQVRLPKLPRGGEGYKPLENVWLTGAGLGKVLAGGVPDVGDLQEKALLYSEESRLGIARNNQQRTVQKGLLYQSRHIRLVRKVELAIEVDLTGLEAVNIDKRLVRLGGEGRMAGIEVVTTPEFPVAPTPTGNTGGLILLLLSPARFGGKAWLPAGFAAIDENGCRVWKGAINGISLTVHCAVIGKPQREGGWDMAKKAPRPVQSLLPAGSAWYCTVDDGNLAKAIPALHDKQVGEDQKLGRGRIACGLWNNNEMTTLTKGEV